MTPTPPHTLTDEQLVARFRAGDDRAFTAIHDRHRAALVAFARRLLHGSGHDADDVLQDAFMRAHAALRATDRPMALRPWLYMIVRNRAMDDLRRPQRARGGLDEELHVVADDTHDPADLTLARVHLRRVVQEIGRLPERQRLALVMRELDGASHAEVAGALRTTVPATKSLLHRARETLAEAVSA